MSPYHAFSDKPTINIDPNGATDGWVEDSKGTVSWDEKTNSKEDFKKNYTDKGKAGFKYVSDSDNPNSYTLPSGEGKLILNEWSGKSKIEDGSGTVGISMTFKPTNENDKAGWTQTYSSNIPDVNSNTLYTALPQKTAEERLDGFGVQQSNDVNKARFFNGFDSFGTPNQTLNDRPSRAFNPGATSPVTFSAQSTMLVNGKRVVSLGWGFTVNSQTRQKVQAPKILKTTTEFHNNAVNKLSEKVLAK